MDQKIAMLSALSFLSKTQSSIVEPTTRHLRIILSAFVEEILSDDEYAHLISLLTEEQYLLTKADQLTLTRQGTALAQALGTQILGETAFCRLARMIEDYNRDKSEYIQNLNIQLQDLQQVKESKVRQIDESAIRVVGLIIDLQHKSPYLYRHNFELGSELMRNRESLDREANYEARRLMRSTNYPFVFRINGNILHLIGLVKVPSFTLLTQELYPSAIETIERRYVPDWNITLVSKFFEDQLSELGYLRSGWPGRTFTKYQDFDQVQTNVGTLRECESLSLDFQDLPEDRILVWIESYTSPTKRVLDFLKENLSDLSNDQAILTCLNGLKLRTIPSGSEVELKNVLPDINLAEKEVPNVAQTFLNYWEQTHGIQLTHSIQPVLIVKSNDHEFHYPAETVQIDRYSLQKRLGATKRSPRTKSPPQRYEIIKNLFVSIRDMPYSRLGQYVRFNLRKYAPTVDQLHHWGAFETAIRIRCPMLEFQGGAVSLDPLDIFETECVPVCGRKRILVTHFILPDHVTDGECKVFIQSLGRMFNRYGFGDICEDKNIRIEKYGVSAGRQELENKIRNLSKAAQTDNNIAIAVIPDDADDYYYALKRLLPTRTNTPLQCIRQSSFDDVLAKRFRGFQQLCMKILIKSLKKGESIWNLSNTAGLSQETTLFVGIGFSRHPQEGKVSKCAAVLHNARGDKVSWNIFSTPQERTITKQWFDTLLYRIRDTVEEERPSRLVFYRTGSMYPQEVEAVETSLADSDWLSPITITFVSVLDGSNYRFYLYHQNENRYQNLPAGYAIVLNEREAFLSSSNYDDRELRQGTIIPVRLKLEIGTDRIEDLLKEYHDLTYLNWQASRTTAKHPLVITIAERFAELTREGVPAESMFYLDL